ncbi:SPFH domain-containing protein [Streptomyces sp. NPDC046985]|uniref:SPFH domain-containing protein n=1 Tax=Streptomyces sp. NPDC046985 TaxID=3155377 RepID=UPI0033EFBA84
MECDVDRIEPLVVRANRSASRLIHNEATTEIPVHLLFRDDPPPEGRRDAVPGPVPAVAGPAVVSSRRGTGEQPRFRRRVPAPASARPAARTADRGLRERPARVLPAAAGVLAGACGAAGCALTSWWAGALPPLAVRALGLPVVVDAGLGLPQWTAYAGAGALGLLGFGGLARGRTGRALVLGSHGRYRGTVRGAGLMWLNPLAPRRRIDVRLRHWRSEPMPAADADGIALRAAVLVVWRVRDTARAALGIDDHEAYLRECVEAALARVPVGAPGGGRGSAEETGERLTRLVAREVGPVGLEVFSVRPARVEYVPEVADAMHRRGIEALDARRRVGALTSVFDSVEDTVTRLTTRGLVDLDASAREVLVRDLAAAFCAGRRETAQ